MVSPLRRDSPPSSPPLCLVKPSLCDPTLLLLTRTHQPGPYCPACVAQSGLWSYSFLAQGAACRSPSLCAVLCLGKDALLRVKLPRRGTNYHVLLPSARLTNSKSTSRSHELHSLYIEREAEMHTFYILGRIDRIRRPRVPSKRVCASQHSP